MALKGSWKQVNASHPCPICSVIRGHSENDWCAYSEDIDERGRVDTHVLCMRSNASEGEILRGSDGITYRMWKHTAQGNIWEPYEQWERFQPKDRKSIYPTSGATTVYKAKPVVETRYEGVSDILPPEKLDIFYRSLLQNLILETKDREVLKAEWGDRTDSILQRWPIKSLPPADAVRFSSKERYDNLSRKKLMEIIISQCGEPRGVPGFYIGNNGLWTTYKLSGIVYPIYDQNRRIVRVRIGDRHPLVSGRLGDTEGTFSYRKTEEGTGWVFQPEGASWQDARLVWVYGCPENKISLDKKGLPDVPGKKVGGKYKNFSSYSEDKSLSKTENGIQTVVNRYKDGCQSGSHCSVFTKEGDDTRVVYITEGEKKAIVANEILGVITVSVPGVSTFGKLFEAGEGCSDSIIESLKAKGMRLAVIAYDSDKAENDKVLKSELGAVKRLIDGGTKVGVANWNPRWGKGLDDILLKGVMPDVSIVA